MSWRLRHRCSRSCEASAGQEQKFGFAGPSSEKPGTDFNQVHDINGFLVSEGHSGCLGENYVRGRGRMKGVSGRMGACACLEVVGTETLGTGAGLLLLSSKYLSSAFPRLLVYFKKNNILSYIKC